MKDRSSSDWALMVRVKRQRLIPQSVGIDGSHYLHTICTDRLKQFDAIKTRH